MRGRVFVPSVRGPRAAAGRPVRGAVLAIILLGLAACNGPTIEGNNPGPAGKYTVTVRTDPPSLQIGQKATFNYTFTDPTGKQVTNLPLVGARTVHTTLVNHDLTWFRTGEAVGPVGGAYPVNLRLDVPDSYRLYAEFTSAYTPTEPLVYRHTISFGNNPPSLEQPAPLVPSSSLRNAFYGVDVTLDTGGPLRAGQPAVLHYTLTTGGAAVRDLAPFDGAAGHLFSISADGADFDHLLARESADSASGPDLTFAAKFGKPGLDKLWLQFLYHGQVVTADFVVQVAP
ncbi:MAG TPA: hypothetical protein VKY74_08460 [Chloroflexia bacterium]|nr:hypothetical protein [Chloroflexia bacterium]